MKNCITLIICLLPLFADAQTAFYYHSNKHLNTSAAAGTSAVEVSRDAAGNLYAAGIFSGSTDFDPGPDVSNLNTTENLANYIAKYSPAGNLLWAKKIEPAGTTGSLLLTGVCVDNVGSLIIFGGVLGTVDMDPGAGTSYITEVNLANGYLPGDFDPFVAKYDASGNFLWAWVIGAVHPQCGAGCVDFHVADVAVDATNNLFVYGDFQNNAYFNFDFDPTGSTAFISDNGATDLFIAKYSPEGAFIKAINLGGDSDDMPGVLETTSGGTITVTGGFRGTGDFDPGSGSSIMSSNGPNLDVFIARYTTANLAYVWAAGGDGSISENELYGQFKEDASGNLYINSGIRGPYTADFDPGAGVFNITGQGDSDIVLVKLNASAGFVWAKHLATPQYEGALDIQLDSEDNPWYTFRFYGNLDVDPGAGTNIITSNGVGSAVVKFSPQGNLTNQVFNFSGTGIQNYYELTNHLFYDNNTLLLNGRLTGTVDINPDQGIEQVTSSATYGTNNIVKLSTNQLWVSPNNQNVAGIAGATTFDITSSVNWMVSSSANWLTLSTLSGSGNETLTVNYSANTGDLRNANILVTGDGQTRMVTVTQATGLVCETFYSTDVPKNIDPNSAGTVFSTLNIPLNATIVDLELIDLNITHGWIGDLTIKLKSPSNTEKMLFQYICSNGSAQSMLADFDDEVTLVPGSTCPTILSGPYKPVQAFSGFDGQASNGEWRLSVNDISPQIGGTLNGWGVKVCYVAASPDLTVNISATNVTCNGLADGVATATASGGTGSYSYVWNTGATTATISNLLPGNYSVTVTSGSSTTNTSATITQPTLLLANVSGINPTLGNNGTATASPSGGKSPYLYQWSNGQIFQTIENLAIGSYTCTVTDDNGCAASGSVTLTPSCGMPLNLFESGLTSSSVKLHWADMSAVEYQVQFKENGSAWQKTTLTDTFLLMGSLIPFQTYTWRVRAKCGSSWTIYSPNRTFTTPQSGSTCSSPTNLIFSNITFNSALVDWEPAVGATSYQVRRKASTTGSSWVTISTSSDQYQFNGLQSDMTYSVQVRTKCNGNWFPWTPVYNFHTFVSFGISNVKQEESIINKAAQLTLYPNPAQTSVNLQYEGEELSNEQSIVVVYDASGRLIFKTNWVVNTGTSILQITTSEWQPGVYILRLLRGEMVETRRLVVL